MIGAALGEFVHRRREAVVRRNLLELSLVITAPRPLGRLLDALVERSDHEITNRIGAAVEIQGAEHRLDRVREDRGLVSSTRCILAFAESQFGADPELAANVGQGRCRNHGGPGLGQLPLGEVRVPIEEVIGDDEPEHGVAEEFESLVGLVTGMFGAPRAVGQRVQQPCGLNELVAEPLLE